MRIDLDFTLIIPPTATYIPENEFPQPFREFLTAVGIANPSQYDTYEIAVVIQPKNQSTQLSLFSNYNLLSRKKKRISFAVADSFFLAFEVGHPTIGIREVSPPTQRI